MAQLSDDCFAFGGPLLGVDEALRLIAERLEPIVGEETVPIAQADGRILARALVSPADLPPFDNSAVDGYAVRYADLAAAGETRLPIAARVIAGSRSAPIGAGEAARIFTGAPMPAGADTVFMQEDTREEAGYVILPAGLKRGANRRKRGEDITRGAPLFPAGKRLRPQDIALAAAVGLSELPVRRRLRIALFSTGNELAETNVALSEATIHDANRPFLRLLAERCGAIVSDLGILRDEPVSLQAALAAAARDHDLVLTSGGVSTGEEDHVRQAVERVGSLVFWRVGIKPGRPIALGLLPGKAAGEKAVFVGLPGNPVAVFVTFAMIVRPLIFRLAGASYAPPRALPVLADFTYRKKAGRREYVRVSITSSADGTFVATKFPQDGAGVITSLTQTDGVVELEDDRLEVAKGETLRFLPYALLI